MDVCFWPTVSRSLTRSFFLYMSHIQGFSCFLFSTRPIPCHAFVCTKIQIRIVPAVCFSFRYGIVSPFDTFTNCLCSRNTYEVWSHTNSKHRSIIQNQQNASSKYWLVRSSFSWSVGRLVGRLVGRYPQCWHVQTTFRLVLAVVVTATTMEKDTIENWIRQHFFLFF